MRDSRPSRPGVVDTGEFITGDLGFSRAAHYAREQAARITLLESTVRRLMDKIHREHHDTRVETDRCRFQRCRELRQVLTG